MTTALEVINDTFDSLAIKTANTDLTDEEVSLAVRMLNRMMTSWAREGIELGFTKIADSADELTVPDWTEECIIAQLAMRVAPAFEVEVPVTLGELAFNSFYDLQVQTIHIHDAVYPGTLPLGAGNTSTGATGQNFFTDSTENDLTRDNDISITDNESINLSTD